MKIDLNNVGKRYNREWIFRNLTFSFDINKRYAIIGPNGSGKSTLLQVIAGSTLYNEGSVKHSILNKEISLDKAYKNLSFSAPYLDLIEEMTLIEFFNFHDKMKGWISTLDTRQIIILLRLEKSAHKQIRNFSSGMKQRVRLAQAIFSDVQAVLLDEPATNLDEEGIQLYNFLIEKYCEKRLVIVSSNDKKEYSFCEAIIDMMIYK
ncbi:MAG TPA: ATP-binding cassette domain-containing protein [Chitinophagaceae bacterium]|nr:ATP-binding cassette domain-containing protein [Chitinophagaceae bacterium]